MVYSKWKKRLIAILLRRLLGPLLSPESNKKLHDCVDVSIQEGKFTLKDVLLNEEYVNSIISKRERAPNSSPIALSVRHARIKQLNITLSLEEGGRPSGNSSSVAWKAIQLGSNKDADSARVSLVAFVEIAGFFIELEPTPHHREVEVPLTHDRPSQSSGSVMSTYVDAALSSLRLSSKVTDVRVVLFSRSIDETRKWVEFRLASAHYHEVDTVSHKGVKSDTPKRPPFHDKIFHKALDFSGVEMRSGEISIKKFEERDGEREGFVLGRSEGTGQIKVEAYAVTDSVEISLLAKESSNENSSRFYQDIAILLDQRYDLSFDEASISNALAVTRSLKSAQKISFPEADRCEGLSGSARELSSDVVNAGMSSNLKSMQEDDLADVRDLHTISGMMKQYYEARELAETNQLRGGILLPSSAYEDGSEDGSVTFDAFFDANDQSFFHYKSILEESVMMPAVSDATYPDFIHTKIKFRLLGGGVKLNFSRAVSDPRRADRSFPNDYVLLTFGDLNISSSLSFIKSELALSISQFEIEDSVLARHLSASTIDGLEERIEIGSVLRFSQLDSNPEIREIDVVSQCPCISLHVSRNTGVGQRENWKVSVDLDVLDILCRGQTLRNVSLFLPKLDFQESYNQSSPPAGDPGGASSALELTCSCPSITISSPVEDDGVLNQRFIDTFSKSASHEVGGSLASCKIGVVIDNTSIGLKRNQDIEDGSFETRKDGFFECDHIVLFVECPSLRSDASGGFLKRLDILALSGEVEVNPHIPISLMYRDLTGIHEERRNTIVRKSFPIVPDLSSFKTRQEDEEKDIEDMYKAVYSTPHVEELHDMEVRSGPRATDPQPSMLSVASKCDSLVEVHIPQVIGDCSKREGTALLDIMLNFVKSCGHDCRTHSEQDTAQASLRPSPRLDRRCGFAITLDVCNFGAYDERVSETDESHAFSLVCDKCRGFATIDAARLTSVRLFAHDFALYEVHKQANHTVQEFENTVASVDDRFKAVRARNETSSCSKALPVFYRSKMFSPISAGSPSVLVDLLAVGSDCVGVPLSSGDRAIYCSIYNVTFRYDLHSVWPERLGNLLRNDDVDIPYSVRDPSNANGIITSGCDNQESVASLTRVFVSCADCNVDYQSPKEFHTASRTIVRLSDVRLTSNLMSPPGDVQAYRISLSDVSMHLSNTRSTYSSENACLTHSSHLMSPVDLAMHLGVKRDFHPSPEAALKDLNFITVATLDSIDALLAIERKTKGIAPKAERVRTPEPTITASLNVGQFCLYGCRDSYQCLTDTIGEYQVEMTLLSKSQVRDLETKSLHCEPGPKNEHSPASLVDNTISGSFASKHGRPEFGDQKTSQLFRQTTQTCTVENATPTQEFLLDGYDWTTVDSESTRNGELLHDEEHSARWFKNAITQSGGNDSSDRDYFVDGDGKSSRPFQLFPQHISLSREGDNHDDMNAARLAGTSKCPQVAARILVRELSFRLRFFDGYDWPSSSKVKNRASSAQEGPFIISAPKRSEDADDEGDERTGRNPRKDALMEGLLEQESCKQSEKTFSNIPLAEEKGVIIEGISKSRRLARLSSRFFQVSGLGVKLRMDSFDKSADHQLASCLHLSVNDLFLVETVGSSKPVKMLGEWVNDVEHPRDTEEGLLMLKMASWYPAVRVSERGDVLPLQNRLVLELLPLRCLLNQSAMRFVSVFFAPDDAETNELKTKVSINGEKKWVVPPPAFLSFKVRQSKLKVDYSPEEVDFYSLREGSYVELVNLSPLNDMVINLQAVSIHNQLGFGLVTQELLRLWIADVCSNQMYKFLTNASPFRPFSNIGGGVADFVVLPWHAIKNGERISDAIRSGALSLAGTVAFEALNTTAKLTKYAAERLAAASMANSQPISTSLLPSRPLAPPRSMPYTTEHAVESLAHGLSAASYKIVIVPVREYHKNGTAGAARSVVRGIPIAIMAPISAASEAVSYTLLGARNQIRPDIRKEEEATHRGLHHGGP